MTDFQKQQEQLGVDLPGVDPTIGEIVLSTILANPGKGPAEIATALVAGAPAEDVAIECMQCMLEVFVLKSLGKDALVWIKADSMSVLTGIRQAKASDKMMMFGNAAWPFQALQSGPPKSVVINTGGGHRRVWLSCIDLEGVSVRQSEAVALGNAMVEEFGGRILEDRQGPEVLRNAAIEENMTTRAQMRAAARTKADKLTIEEAADPNIRVNHARVALAEAIPGTLKDGDRIQPELGDSGELDPDAPVYKVERRVSADWVVVVAEDEGMGYEVDPCAWLYADGSKVPEAPEPYVGFTEDRSKS